MFMANVMCHIRLDWIIIECALYTIYNHILALQIINANKTSNKQESHHGGSEEKTKQVNSLQRQLKDLEDQNRHLQEKLENVCMSIAFILLFCVVFYKIIMLQSCVYIKFTYLTECLFAYLCTYTSVCDYVWLCL